MDGIPVIEVKDVETSLSNRSIKEALILSSLPESMRNSITKVTAETQGFHHYGNQWGETA